MQSLFVADCQQRLPFEDGSFDRALAIHVLEHLPNLPAAVAEIHRLLKPSGRFVVLSGKESDDAKRYQESQVEEAIAAVNIWRPKS